MAANFLHGVETIEVRDGGRPVRMVKSAVIGLVGTAPVWAVDQADRFVNLPVLITSDLDAAKYGGPNEAGYTIPAALEAIRDQGRGVVIIVNVFDPATHKTAQAATAKTFSAAGVIDLGRRGVSGLVVKSADLATTYVAGTDYELAPVTGLVTRKAGGAIASGATVSVAFDYADPTKVTASDIIGAVDSAGHRTGLQGFQDAHGLFGFFPKTLIAPVYCTQTSVSVALIAMADRIRGQAIIDAPIGTTFAQAIAGRGPAGAINFNTSSERAVLCWPHVKVYDSATDADVLAPMSPRLAGLFAEVDIAEGYWVSPSNHEIKGIVGLERRVSAMINDPNSEANLLNEAGIVTVFNAFGSGLRAWGNRSAAFPSSTHPANFMSIRKTFDVVAESVEYAMLQFIDQPLTPATIDSVLATVNGLVRKLIADGALVDGRYWFDQGDNPVTELAAGHLVLRSDLTPPPPLERITFRMRYSTDGLAKLYAQN